MRIGYKSHELAPRIAWYLEHGVGPRREWLSRIVVIIPAAFA